MVYSFENKTKTKQNKTKTKQTKNKQTNKQTNKQKQTNKKTKIEMCFTKACSTPYSSTLYSFLLLLL